MRPTLPNHIVHMELHTGDQRAACEFYERMCGWHAEQIHAGERSYLALDLGERLGGGIVECGVARPLWLPYVEVACIHEATDLARRLGARVLLPPTEGPAGWRSVVSAPGGGEVAFWQQKERA